jgi:hypothetical protein
MKLADLDPAECRRLLRDHAAGGGTGRLLVLARVVPQVHPSRYVIDRDEVVLPVDADVLDPRDHDSVLGLQVDDLDPLTGTGWSVMAVGLAYPITDRAREDSLARLRPDIWSDGSPPSVALALQKLTGQRLRLWSRGGASPCAGHH